MDLHTERVYTNEELEDADFQQVARPGSMVIFPENPSRGDVIEHLSRGIPSNEYGLPIFYVRSDLLDMHTALYKGALPQEDTDSAAELINYQEGYPTFTKGNPFWTQMPHEPRSDYLLFQNFLNLVESEGIRLMDSLATIENIPLERVRELHKEFYWSSRARAYDLFIVAAEAKKRQALTRKAENEHYAVAGTVLDKIIERINNEPDLIDEMAVDDLFDLFEKMVKVQRLSLGLTGQNASTLSPELHNPGQSVELVLRNLTKNSGLTDEGSASIQDRLTYLMQDENTALSAQELIIRATTGNLVPKTTGS